ncbi:MAG TPA: AMP-binding protein, partial [Methyloversatilis sp.]
MNRQIQDAYVVAAKRTAVARKGGAFRHVRPDDMLAHVLRGVVDAVPAFDRNEIGDVVVGCAMPEAEQGMNVARIGLLLAGLPDSVPGVTVNRFCASGLNAIADAAIIFEADDGAVTHVSYSDLLARVCRLANALRARGVKKGDRVVIYMPMSIE